jgi:tetratricopeptide (TPR) repeat protein/DNA-binding SARP family transcriptional activator
VDRVWGDSPPDRVRHAIYAYVARLRAALAPSGPRLVRRSRGYLLDVDPESVDVHRFQRILTRARTSSSPDRARAELLRDGLGLWRGSPLAEMPGEWAAGMRQVWQQQRLDAVVLWAEIELRRDNPAAVIDAVTRLVAEHPLHEPLTGALMRALHAGGRIGEALACYARIRSGLVEQLGVDPSAELRQVHQSILHSDLGAAEPAAETVAIPAQLPADVAGFTGRDLELSLLERRSTATGEMVISAIAGTGGVGKTALAVHFAHRIRDRFPDGQLYVDLRGYDDDHPAAPGDVLAAFLRALGVPGATIPAETEERAAVYRTLLARRKILILLDNASSVEQISLLLPGSPSCLVLVTSRDSLAGLVARHGARRLDLDVLPAEEAVALLHRLIGARVHTEPVAADALATQCDRLPLALRIVAELAIARPGSGLAELADELADRRQRLDLLDAGTGIRAVFSFSYKQLPADAARAFRVLGLHPGVDVDPYAMAALLGTDLFAARHVLDLLARAHLVQRADRRRFGMHDLVRVYAAELAAAHDSADECRAALTRLFDHYLYTAATAMNQLTPGDRHRRPDLPAPATPVPDLPDSAAALAWADAERENLVLSAATRGWPAHTIRFAAVLWRYLDIGGHYDDALTLHAHALDAAREPADRATVLDGIGTVHYRRGDYPRAGDLFTQAVDLYRTAGDRGGQGHLLINLGNVRHQQGRLDEAVHCYRQGLALHEQLGDRLGMFRAHNNLGNTVRAQGDYQRAIGHLTEALVIIREVGDRDGEAHSLDELGFVHLRLGDYASAAVVCVHALDAYHEVGSPLGIAHVLNSLGTIRLKQGDLTSAFQYCEQALAGFRRMGVRGGEAEALASLGAIAAEQGDLDLAAEHHRGALALFTQLGSEIGEASALNNLGVVSTAAGKTADAYTEHSAALTIAERIGDRYERARAHAGLGHALHANGNLPEARSHWDQALSGFAELGVPDGDQLRTTCAR